jgi:DNA polymerase-4
MLIRLIGVRYTNLVPGNYQISLYEDTEEMISLYQAVNSIKKRYGEDLLIRARGLIGGRSGRESTGPSGGLIEVR